MAMLLTSKPALVVARGAALITLASLAHPAMGAPALDGPPKYEDCKGQCGAFCETEPIGTARHFRVVGFEEPEGTANIWGSGPEFYWDSYVDEAVYFAGLLAHNEGGYIQVTCVEEPFLYTEGFANGVSSKGLTPGQMYKYPPAFATPGAFTLQLMTPPKDDIAEDDHHEPTASGGDDSAWAEYWQDWTPVWVITGVILCLIAAVVLVMRHESNKEKENRESSERQIREAFSDYSSNDAAEEDSSQTATNPLFSMNETEPEEDCSDDDDDAVPVVTRAFTQAKISPGSHMTNPLPSSEEATPCVATALTTLPLPGPAETAAPVPYQGTRQERQNYDWQTRQNLL